MNWNQLNYQINEQVVWIENDDEIRLYNGIVGDFLTLNSTAAEIWSLVARGLPLHDITATLVQKYGEGGASEAARVAQDTSGFLDSLVAQGLLDAVPRVEK